MNLLNILRNTLNEERSIPQGKKHLLLLDIDDTLLKAKNNMKIYHKPTGRALSPEEYAKESNPKSEYDYRDFRDPKKVYESIVNGAPYINNLKVLDDFYNAGADIGILTARGCEDIVYKAIKAFLRVKDKNGKLIKPVLPRERVHGVNDDDKFYPGNSDAEKKKNVIRSYYNKYDYITLFDDDVKNIKNALSLKKEDPEAKNKIRTIDAKKNRGEASAPVEEEIISETRRRPASEEMLMAANDGDYKKVITIYFNENKNSSKYAGKKDAVSVLRLMINHGIPRFFLVREKNGDEVLEGVTQKIKEWGLKHIDELANEVEYEGNPDYVAPKKSLRKKFMAEKLEDLEKMIAAAKEKGYVFKDEPKQGSTAKDGNFYYAYGSIKNVNENANITLQTLLTEMASKDVTPDIRKAIANKDYRKALVDYFNKVKGGKAYEKYGDDLGAIYDQVRTYGMMRAFGAEERAGNVPAGTAQILKRTAEENRNSILSDLGFDPKAPTIKEKKKETKKYVPTSSDLEKIDKRITDYEKRAEALKDYALTGESIKPFIVDIERNGEGGVDKYAQKQRLSTIDFDFPEATESERRLMPIMKFRKRNIPDFIQKKALSEINFRDKKNLEKAETLGEVYAEATKNKIFAQYMAKYLSNIVEGYKDFKRLNKDASMEELKTEVDFPYKDFVALEKWYKSAKIKSDEEDYNSGRRQRADVKIPDEVERVKKEYITYLNELEKAIAEEKLIEFFESPNNYAVAYGAVNEPMTNSEYDSGDFPERITKYWEQGKHTSYNQLSPGLKRIFSERAEESKDMDFKKRYSQLAGTLSGLRINLFLAKKKGDEEEVERIYPKLEKCAKDIINVIIDRLIAVDLLAAAFGNPIYMDLLTAAKRYEKIKQAKLKEKPFNPNDEKYRKFYTPEKSDTEFALDDMYDAIKKSVDKLSIPEMLQRRLQIPKTVNIPGKRYSEEEVKELYNALKQGDEKLYELLATDKFRARREEKA